MFPTVKDGPQIVCLCGSTKFKEKFEELNTCETLAGRIVLSVGLYAHADGRWAEIDAAKKRALDELHLRKIDLADEVLIINVDGYVGLSTRREAWYAERMGKRLRWLEPPLIEHDGIMICADPADVRALVRAWFEDWDAWRLAALRAAERP